MLYAMLATDKPGHLWLREKYREEHTQYLRDAGAMVRAAGRTLSGDGGDANGSFMICQADRIEDVRALLDRDPFVVHELYEKIELRPWHWVLGDGKPREP